METKLETALIKYIENILDKENRKEWFAEAGKPLSFYVPKDLKAKIKDNGKETPFKLKYIVNGKKIDNENYILKSGDELIITPELEGPFALLGGIVGGLIGVSKGLIIWKAVLAGFAIGGMFDSLFGTSFFKPKVPSFSGGAFGASPTYGWDGIRNITNPDSPVPVVYGRHRVGGAILNVFTSAKKQYDWSWETLTLTSETQSSFVNTFRVTEKITGFKLDLNAYCAQKDVGGGTYGYPKLGNPGGGDEGLSQSGKAKIVDCATVPVSKSLEYFHLSYKIEIKKQSEGWDDTTIEPIIVTPTDAQIVDNRVYNPGWETVVDDEVAVELPEDLYDIRVTLLGDDITDAPVDIKYYTTATVTGKVYTPSASKPEKEYLNVLIGLSEGPIQEVETGTIEINKNPIRNYLGGDDDPEFFWRNGTNAQTPIPGFNDIHAAYTKNQHIVYQSAGYTYQTISSLVEAFELELTFPSGLYQINRGNGELEEWEVQYKVSTSPAGEGSWTVLGTMTVKKNSQSSFTEHFRKDGLTAGQYDIKVERMTGGEDAYHIGDLYLTEIDEILYDDLAYPNTALLALKILATDRLSGAMPTITVVIKGKKVKQPKVMAGGVTLACNEQYYDAAFKKYDGSAATWDETTYVDQWSDNPIWIMRDLLTNDRYGLGQEIAESNLSMTVLNINAKYAMEMVEIEDGSNIKRHRFTLNVVIDSSDRALDLIKQLAATFRGLIYQIGGIIRVVAEKEESAVQMFTMGNIKEGLFAEAWTSYKTIPNRVEVQFLNADRNWERDIVRVEDSASILAGDPIRSKELALFGITWPDQALRMAAFSLNYSKYCSRIIKFEAGIDSVVCIPGDIIKFQHDVPQWGEGGRIVSATISSITIEKEVTIEEGKTYKVQVRLATGVVEERTVSDDPGDYTTLNVTVNFTAVPPVWGLWTFGEVASKPFRILDIKRSSSSELVIQAIEHRAEMFDDITGTTLPEEQYSLLANPLGPPPNVTDLTLYNSHHWGGGIYVSFVPPITGTAPFWDHAEIYLSNDAGETYSKAGESKGETLNIPGLTPGLTYYVKVVSVSNRNIRGAFDTSPSTSILVRTLITPPDVQGLELKGQGNDTEFKGRDAKFEWKEISMTTAVWPAGEEPFGAGTGTYDTFFKDYRVEIWVSGVRVRTEHVGKAEYIYSFEKNVEDNDTAQAEFTIKVWLCDIFSQQSDNAAELTVTNPVPAQIAGVTVDFTGIDCVIRWAESSELDLEIYELQITGSGGTQTIRIKATAYTYDYDSNVKDNTAPGDPSLTVDLYAIDAFAQKSVKATIAAINEVPAQVANLTTLGGFRSVSFAWDRCAETDFKCYTYRTKITAGGDWSGWSTTDDNWFTRILSQAEIDTHTVLAAIYLEVKAKDMFDQVSAVVAAADETAEDIAQIDMAGAIFQIKPTDSDDNLITTLKALYDGLVSTGGVAYTANAWLQYEFPIEQTFNKIMLWPLATFNCYVGYSQDGTSWSFLKAEADHTLDANGKLLEATDEADAQTNYWTTGTGDDGGPVTGLWPYMRQAKYVKLFIRSNVTLYEVKYWTYAVLDEIDAGILHLARGLTIASVETDDDAVVIDTAGMKAYHNATDLGNTSLTRVTGEFGVETLLGATLKARLGRLADNIFGLWAIVGGFGGTLETPMVQIVENGLVCVENGYLEFEPGADIYLKGSNTSPAEIRFRNAANPDRYWTIYKATTNDRLFFAPIGFTATGEPAMLYIGGDGNIANIKCTDIVLNVRAKTGVIPPSIGLAAYSVNGLINAGEGAALSVILEADGDGFVRIIAEDVSPSINATTLLGHPSATIGWKGLYLAPLAARPYAAEGIIWAKTDHHLYYYNGSTDVQLDN